MKLRLHNLPTMQDVKDLYWDTVHFGESLFFRHDGTPRNLPKPVDVHISQQRYHAQAAAEVARRLVESIGCVLRGHTWVDHGYAGPESGAIVMICERCGESFGQVLY